MPEKTLEREETDTGSLTDSIGTSDDGLSTEKEPDKIVDKVALGSGLGIAAGLQIVGTVVGLGLLTGPLSFLVMGAAVGLIFDEGVGEAAIAGFGVGAGAYLISNILATALLIGIPGLVISGIGGFLLAGIAAYGVKYLASR